MGLLVRMDTNTYVTVGGEIVKREVLLQESSMISSGGGQYF